MINVIKANKGQLAESNKQAQTLSMKHLFIQIMVSGLVISV